MPHSPLCFVLYQGHLPTEPGSPCSLCFYNLSRVSLVSEPDIPLLTILQCLLIIVVKGCTLVSLPGLLVETDVCFTSALWWSFCSHIWGPLASAFHYFHWGFAKNIAHLLLPVETQLCCPSRVTGCHPSPPLPSPMVIPECSVYVCWFLCRSVSQDLRCFLS